PTSSGSAGGAGAGAAGGGIAGSAAATSVAGAVFGEHPAAPPRTMTAPRPICRRSFSFNIPDVPLPGRLLRHRHGLGAVVALFQRDARLPGGEILRGLVGISLRDDGAVRGVSCLLLDELVDAGFAQHDAVGLLPPQGSFIRRVERAVGRWVRGEDDA